MAELSPYPGTPRWVKILGIIVLIVVMLLFAMMLARGADGRHGPGLHRQSGDAAGHTQPEGPDR